MPNRNRPMNSASNCINRRILVVDDNEAIHKDFRMILEPTPATQQALDHAEQALFQTPASAAPVLFEIDTALQGEAALHLVRRAMAEQRPYAMAFIDIRMPPGWNGIETANRIWDSYPDLQIVLCTAHSDYTWGEMFQILGASDHWLILKKPFDTIEAIQLAHTLTMKWQLTQWAHAQWKELETRIDQSTHDLARACLQLQRHPGLSPNDASLPAPTKAPANPARQNF